MNFKIIYIAEFEKQLKTILEKFPKSARDLQNLFEDIEKNPNQGNRYPGFGENAVYKLRIGLKKYNVGKSKGLRFVYLVVPDKKVVIPLCIYHKSDYGGEAEIVKNLKSILKTIAIELEISS